MRQVVTCSDHISQGLWVDKCVLEAKGKAMSSNLMSQSELSVARLWTGGWGLGVFGVNASSDFTHWVLKLLWDYGSGTDGWECSDLRNRSIHSARDGGV